MAAHSISRLQGQLEVHAPALGEGATLAYSLGLQFPEKFGGVISLNGALSRGGGPLLRLPAVRQLRVFIGHGIANATVPLSLARQPTAAEAPAACPSEAAPRPRPALAHIGSLRP